jgi:hypothetical protein
LSLTDQLFIYRFFFLIHFSRAALNNAVCAQSADCSAEEAAAIKEKANIFTYSPSSLALSGISSSSLPFI